MKKKFYKIDNWGQNYKKSYRFVIYSLSSKLICLSKPVKVTDKIKDTSLLQNLSISHKLQIRNALYYRPQVNQGLVTDGDHTLDRKMLIRINNQMMTWSREVLLKEKDQYGWPPH